jgi:hypothetical protein
LSDLVRKPFAALDRELFLVIIAVLNLSVVYRSVFSGFFGRNLPISLVPLVDVIVVFRKKLDIVGYRVVINWCNLAHLRVSNHAGAAV